MVSFTNLFKRHTPATLDQQITGYLATPRGIRAMKGYAGSPDWYMFNDIPTEDILTPSLQGLGYAYAISVWIYRCVWARANAVAGIPLAITNTVGEPLSQHPLARLLATTNRRLIRETESDLCIFGHAFWKPYRDGGRWMIRRWNPMSVEVVLGKGGYGIQKYIQHIPGTPATVVYPDELVHFRYYDPHNDFGSVSPTLACLRDVQVDVNAWEFVKAFFENDATPNLFITTEATLQKTDIERLAGEWARDHQGAKRSHKPKFGHKGMNVQQLQNSMKDLIIPELDERTIRRICAAFGVPLTVALATDAANYATADIQRKSFYTETILPEMDMLTDEINRQLTPIVCRYEHQKPFVTYNQDEIEALQESPLEKTQRARTGYQAGIRSLNEARKLDGEPELPMDYFVINGQMIPRQAIESGQLPSLPPAPLFSLPTSVNSQPYRSALPTIIDVVVKSHDNQLQVVDAAVRSAILGELTKWERKALNRHTKARFEAEYIPSTYAAFIRQDLAAVHPIHGDIPSQVKSIFANYSEAFKQLDNDFATPEEFEAFWNGFDVSYDDLQSIFAQYLATLPDQMAAALRSGAKELTLDTESVVNDLIGTSEQPGPLMAIFLAGAARGNELVERATGKSMALKQGGGVGVAWDILSQEALDYARQYSFDLVRGVNDTTARYFQESIASWLESGGNLGELADLIEGNLQGITIPPDWSDKKIAWATSPERASMIATTESTRTFQEGVKQRWRQLGIKQAKWRTANDSLVCPRCRALNNQIGSLTDGWELNGVKVTIPLHPSCRCLSSPVL